MTKSNPNNLAVCRLAESLEAYDNAYPDVGMGYSFDHFIDQAAKELKLSPADYDKSAVHALRRK